MANSNGIELANEMFFRLDQRITPNQAIFFLNHGLARIDSAASWIWDQVSVFAAVPVTNTVTLPTMNQGKKISCFNSINKLPISRVDQTDMASSASGYLNVSTTIYSTFSLSTNVTTFDPMLTFYPPLPGFPTVDIYYHRAAPTLVINNPLVTVRWSSPEMDDVLLDLGEEDARRFYKMPTTPGFFEDAISRLTMLSAAYSTERINTGPPSEVSGSKAENDGAGRN